MTSLKIGFVGFGNMAEAMAKGWLAAGVPAANLLASARRADVLRQKTATLGMTALSSNLSLAEAADLVVIAVKPYLVESVITEMGDALKGKLVLSVAVNVHAAQLQPLLTKATGEAAPRALAILPNTPVAVNQGILLAEETPTLSPDDMATFTELLNLLGRVVVLPTDKMGIGGVVAGCGPAFAALFIEALGDAAVKYGLPRAAAYELVSQMIVGTGALQLASGLHPGVMKDAVCSPGGTTIQGVTAMEREGFRAAAIAAVDAVMQKK